jgi:hypothetical protein
MARNLFFSVRGVGKENVAVEGVIVTEMEI